jgi:hypothetical protein
MDDSLLVAVCKVAELFLIPPESRPLFCEYLSRHVRGASLAGWRGKQPQPLAWLKPIVEHASALRDSLLSLGDEERLVIAETLGGNLLTSFSILGPLGALAERGKELMARGEALSGPQRPQTKKGLGAPEKPLPWKPDALAPEAFVVALVTLVEDFSGTLPTSYMDHGKKAGSLSKALDLLRPHLGEPFVRSLTSAVLRRVIRKIKEARAPDADEEARP